MQLKQSTQNQLQFKSLREKLALATCSVLQVTSQAAHAETEWDVKAAMLMYSENNGRVKAFEPIATARKEIAEDQFINIKLVLDSLTGATPNGAHASSNPQTFTSPSGNNNYTTPANETPLDNTFHDSRVALSGEWEMPILDNNTRAIWGASFSNEFDYTSLGASATFLRDYNNRNTTVTAALGVNTDSIDAVGGTPVPFAHMQTAGASLATTRDGSSETKTITDLLLGVTQVINRSTLMQFNLGLSNTSGYQNDPYKILTVVGADGLPVAISGSDRPYLYESRPDSRSRQTFYWKTVHHLSEDVINVAYRYYTDDWDISSHTLDLHYRYELGGGAYLQPHVRYYSQSAAKFFRTSLRDGEALPDYASADYRLGEFTTNTLGLKYAQVVGKDSEFSLRVESITQTQSDVGTPIGDQINQDLTPDLDSYVIQLGYSFKW